MYIKFTNFKDLGLYSYKHFMEIEGKNSLPGETSMQGDKVPPFLEFALEELGSAQRNVSSLSHHLKDKVQSI